MSANPYPILSNLHRQGFNVGLRGDGVVLKPASAISDDVRAYVKQQKSGLVAELLRQSSDFPDSDWTFDWDSEQIEVSLFDPVSYTHLTLPTIHLV